MTRILSRVFLVIAIALLAGAAAVAFSESQPTEYQATIRLGYGRIVAPELQVLGSDFGDLDIDENVRMQTEALIVDSYDVAAATARAAPELGYSAGGINSRVSAAPRRGTLVMSIVARAPSRDRAKRLVEAYVSTFLADKRREERERAGAIEEALERRLDQLSARDRLGVRGDRLRGQINTVAVIRRLGSGSPEIIQQPLASGSPAQPQTSRNVLFGVLFGLVVGIGLVSLRGETRRRATAAAARRAAQVARGEPPRTR